MDAPQRWQLASTVTAVAGLGIGAILLGRPSTEPVATIDLDTVVAVERRDDPPPLRIERMPEIVQPRVIEDVPAGSTTSSGPSIDSPDEPSSGSGSEAGSGSTSSSPAPSPSPTPAPAPTSDTSFDSPDSVDSPSSADSD